MAKYSIHRMHTPELSGYLLPILFHAHCEFRHSWKVCNFSFSHWLISKWKRSLWMNHWNIHTTDSFKYAQRCDSLIYLGQYSLFWNHHFCWRSTNRQSFLAIWLNNLASGLLNLFTEEILHSTVGLNIIMRDLNIRELYIYLFVFTWLKNKVLYSEIAIPIIK